MLKIFLSWSGAQSEAVADALRVWLRRAFRNVDPWMSASDIEKGARWNQEIARSLGSANFGIICLTPDNLASPWLLFEAGALSKHTDQSRVCTYLRGLNPADVSGPLSTFQATRANREDTFKLVQAINSQLGEESAEADELEDIYSVWWPRLEAALHAAPRAAEPQLQRRNDRELIEEVLQIARSISTRLTEVQAIPDSSMQYFDLACSVARKSMEGITGLDARTVEKSRQAVRIFLHDQIKARNDVVSAVEFDSIVVAAVEREAVLARNKLKPVGPVTAKQEW